MLERASTTAAPRTRPILFSAPMVRALLSGRKTQTRRMLNPQPGRVEKSQSASRQGKAVPCRQGAVGDLLWVRERWGHAKDLRDRIPVGRAKFVYAADVAESLRKGPGWRGSFYMPREASRVLLKIVARRVERLQAISERDARAEGYDPSATSLEPRAWYRQLWNSINTDRKHRWKANPWVWVIEFEVVSPPARATL